jgi:hypothetical protein
MNCHMGEQFTTKLIGEQKMSRKTHQVPRRQDLALQKEHGVNWSQSSKEVGD